MPGTFLSLHYHLVFSTKHREPMIGREWRARLHDYLGGIVHNLDAFPQSVGGTTDHVHLLFGAKSTLTLADFVRDLKKGSSAWIHDELKRPAFAWQEGYAAFTVSPTARKSVRAYIVNQEEHHQVRTYRQELVEMLEKAGVEYESKYLD